MTVRRRSLYTLMVLAASVLLTGHPAQALWQVDKGGVAAELKVQTENGREMKR